MRSFSLLSLLVAILLVTIPCHAGAPSLDPKATQITSEIRQPLELSRDDVADSFKTEFGKAFILQKRGQYRQSCAIYNRIASLVPKAFEIYYNLGLCLEEQGKFGEAEAAFRKAAKIDPGAPSVFRHLAYLCYKQKKIKDAATAWEIYLDL